MRRFGYFTRHVKVKDRFGRTSPFFRQATPTGIAHALGAIPYKTIPNKISIDMIIIFRPVVLEIVEKGRPVRQQMVNLEIT